MFEMILECQTNHIVFNMFLETLEMLTIYQMINISNVRNDPQIILDIFKFDLPENYYIHFICVSFHFFGIVTPDLLNFESLILCVSFGQFRNNTLIYF